MKKNFIKTVVAAVCVVASGMGGMKAYNAANQSEADMLLAENVEALSQNESKNESKKDSKKDSKNDSPSVEIPCKYTGNPMDYCSFTGVDADGNTQPLQLQCYLNV